MGRKALSALGLRYDGQLGTQFLTENRRSAEPSAVADRVYSRDASRRALDVTVTADDDAGRAAQVNGVAIGLELGGVAGG